MEGAWTILELAERAAETLSAPTLAQADARTGADASAAQVNGRVRDVPNERLIRWYVTVGLVDPPLSRRGRVARYGRRHLLQLVAVKRRQADGRSLAEIQAELAGATDEVLADIARLPGECAPDPGPAPGMEAAARSTEAAEGVTRAAPDRFWTRRPSQPGAAAARHGDHPDRGGPGLVHGVSLAPGVVLLLEGADRAPGPDDLTGIVTAARPLLEELADRGLCAFGPGYPPGVEGA
jgi:DNA-binding transcriptional MerR regulator